MNSLPGTSEEFLAALLALPVFLQTETEARPSIEPGPRLAQAVVAGFRLQGTTMNHWCKQNGITQQNANQAIRGSWNGPKAKQLLSMIVPASGADALLNISEHKGKAEVTGT